MQAAWIISAHLVEAWLFETSSVLGLHEASRSKNTISQVVRHELKIAEHGFPVRLLLQTSPTLQSTRSFVDRRPPSLQPDEDICRNEREKKPCQLIWTQIHDLHTPSLAPPIALHGMTVIWGCFHNVLPSNFSGVYFRDVWIRWQTAENVAATPQRSCFSELSERRPNPPPPEPLHKRWD